MRIYVASSWRNEYQPEVVRTLRAVGHEVYDFKNPAPGNNGFHWSEVDPEWQSWTAEQFRGALQHDVAARGFGSDVYALNQARACVLVLPSGRGAHLEAGFAVGQGKPLVIYIPPGVTIEPELMYRWACGRIAVDMPELIEFVQSLDQDIQRAVCR